MENLNEFAIFHRGVRVSLVFPYSFFYNENREKDEQEGLLWTGPR